LVSVLARSNLLSEDEVLHYSEDSSFGILFFMTKQKRLHISKICSLFY